MTDPLDSDDHAYEATFDGRPLRIVVSGRSPKVDRALCEIPGCNRKATGTGVCIEHMAVLSG